MKKHIINFISLLLIVTFVLPVKVMSSSTDNNINFFNVFISTGEGASSEKAVIKDGDIYIPAASFSKYTRYSYDENEHRFTIKGQDASKAFKKIKLDPKTKLVNISGKKLFSCQIVLL